MVGLPPIIFNLHCFDDVEFSALRSLMFILSK